MNPQNTTESPSVRLVREGTTAQIILSRPLRKNAIDQELAHQLLAALREANDDERVHAILLRGEGGAFCSGLDLDALQRGTLDAGLDGGFAALWREVHHTVWRLEKPLVGALERYAINAGAALALACDFLVCDESGFLQVGEVRMGMAAPMNLLWLQAKWGLAKATRVTLLGDRLDGRALVELGIAHQCHPASEVIEQATLLQQQLADFPSAGCRRILRQLRGGTGPFGSISS